MPSMKLGSFLVITFLMGFLMGGLITREKMNERLKVLKTDETGTLEAHLQNLLKGSLDLQKPAIEGVLSIVHDGVGEWAALRMRHRLFVRELILKHGSRIEVLLDPRQKGVFQNGLKKLLADYPGESLPVASGTGQGIQPH